MFYRALSFPTPPTPLPASPITRSKHLSLSSVEIKCSDSAIDARISPTERSGRAARGWKGERKEQWRCDRPRERDGRDKVDPWSPRWTALERGLVLLAILPVTTGYDIYRSTTISRRHFRVESRESSHRGLRLSLIAVRSHRPPEQRARSNLVRTAPYASLCRV